MLAERNKFEYKLALYLKELAEKENIVETAKQLLAEEVLFEPYPAFNYLDGGKKGYLSRTDISQFLK